MKRMLNNLVVMMATIGLLALLQSCGEKQEQKEEVKTKYVIPDSLLKLVKIDTVKNIPLVNVTKFTGMVDFNQDKQVNIFPLVSGNVQDMKLQLGDYVTAGQVLGVVKSPEMANYSNNLVVAQTNLSAAKRQLEATKSLYDSKLASGLDLTNAQVNYDQAVAQLDMVKKILKINGDNVKGEWQIKAPVSGFIVQKNVSNGTAIRTDNGNPLFVISDLKNVWIWANVYEADLDKVHVGDKVDVTTLSFGNKVFKGVIDKELKALDPTSKVTKMRVELENPEYLLRPQMYASVNVTTPGEGKVLTVPKSALIFENSRYYVLTYKGKGNADITPIEVSSIVGDNVYIQSGVNEGDKVIGSFALQIYGELNN